MHMATRSLGPSTKLTVGATIILSQLAIRKHLLALVDMRIRLRIHTEAAFLFASLQATNTPTGLFITGKPQHRRGSVAAEPCVRLLRAESASSEASLSYLHYH